MDEKPLPRGLRLNDAAAYCGLRPGTFRKVAPAPMKVGRCSVWDRRVLDRWLDGLSGSALASDEAAEAAKAEAAMLQAIEGWALERAEFERQEKELLAEMRKEEAIATEICASAGGSKTAIYNAGADVRRKYKAQIKALKP